ncbi:MAG: aminoacyl-histidine dipeptidase [Bacteroidales bacterium]|nr:aminoacyl-histidine dipeptidase [Bacteroidales bacterium]
MNNSIRQLQPSLVWEFFDDICQIPRPSKKEGKIKAFLRQFAIQHHLEILEDEVGNILIRKEAVKGFETKPWVVMQSHIDMVCEKNSDVIHDFENDPIKTKIEGDWVKAIGTTLGADDGIGVATQLAILASADIDHGPIECLFTIDEETGLTGAFGLKPGFLKSELLLNLDSEDEGELFIGCAGGMDTVATLALEKEEAPLDYKWYRIDISGLRGGHSGDDIHKGYGNANKVLNRILKKATDDFSLRLAKFDGGNLRNAIAREAYAAICVPANAVCDFEYLVSKMTDEIKIELHVTEPNLNINLTEITAQKEVVSLALQHRLIHTIYACPHGVIAWSQDIPNFVDTSTNLAAVKTNSDHILITTSQRSSSETEKRDVVNMVTSVFLLAGASVKNSEGYPGWKPNPNSEIMEITKSSYQKLFKKEPKVLAIHAGLECGLIGTTYPKMDMISYGPTIKGAHSPDERIEIKTVQMFWDLTLDILKSV